MTHSELDQIKDMFKVIFIPALEEMIRNEVRGRVHAEAMRLLDEETSSLIRKSLRDYIKESVVMEVKIK